MGLTYFYGLPFFVGHDVYVTKLRSAVLGTAADDCAHGQSILWNNYLKERGRGGDDGGLRLERYETDDDLMLR